MIIKQNKMCQCICMYIYIFFSTVVCIPCEYMILLLKITNLQISFVYLTYKVHFSRYYILQGKDEVRTELGFYNKNRFSNI